MLRVRHAWHVCWQHATPAVGRRPAGSCCRATAAWCQQQSGITQAYSGVLAHTSVGHLQVLQAGELQQGVQGAAAVSRLVHSQLQGRQLGARGKGLQVCSLQSRPPANKRIQSSILKSFSRFLL